MNGLMQKEIESRNETQRAKDHTPTKLKNRALIHYQMLQKQVWSVEMEPINIEKNNLSCVSKSAEHYYIVKLLLSTINNVQTNKCEKICNYRYCCNCNDTVDVDDIFK